MILLPRFEDQVEEALIRADQEAHEQFGQDETKWTASQKRRYLLALDAARIDAGWTAA
ncbi:hypothetical protein ACFZAR_05350 [Streptomyces sp. NPDC008222]|uniref:hypothetical protein n=1 Tax=Streptomyces sp. NPDC008222 TaxID=3364820 RepID=UPI0036E11F7D